MTVNTAQILSFDTGRSDDLDKPRLIEPGEYEAVLVDWMVYYSGYFKKSTLRIRFRMTEPGKYHGVVLPAWFNVEWSKSKTTVKAGWRSDFLRMYQDCFHVRLDRRDRIPMSRFKSVRLKVEVATIGKDTKGHPLTRINHYSRVRRVLKTAE